MKSSSFLLLLGCAFLSAIHARHHRAYNKIKKHHDEKELRRAKRHLENDIKNHVKVKISPIIHSIRNKRGSRPYVVGQVQDVQIQIKFRSMWNEAMWNKYTPQYRLFAGNIIDAVTNELVDNRNFIEAAVLKLRPNSWNILVDLSIKFFKTEIDPVHYLEGIVSSGWISGLEVFNDYFKLLRIVNGNEAFPAWNYPKGLRLRLHPAVLTKANAVKKVKEKTTLPTNYKELRIAFTLYQKWNPFYRARFSSTYRLLSGNMNEALMRAFKGSPKFLGAETLGFRENQQGQVVVDLLVRFTEDENYPAQKLKILVSTGTVGGTPVISDSLEIYEINNITSDQPIQDQPTTEEFPKPHSDADVSQISNETEAKQEKADKNAEKSNSSLHPKIVETSEPIYPLAQKSQSTSNLTSNNIPALKPQASNGQNVNIGPILALKLDRIKLTKQSMAIVAHHETSTQPTNQTIVNVHQDTSEPIFPKQAPITDTLPNRQDDKTQQTFQQVLPVLQQPQQQWQQQQQQQKMQQQKPYQEQWQTSQQLQQAGPQLQNVQQSTKQLQQPNWSSLQWQQQQQQQPQQQQQQSSQSQVPTQVQLKQPNGSPAYQLEQGSQNQTRAQNQSLPQQQPSQYFQQQPPTLTAPMVQKQSQDNGYSQALAQQVEGKLILNAANVQPQNASLEHTVGQEKQLAQWPSNIESNQSSDAELQHLHEQIMKQQQGNVNVDGNKFTAAGNLPDSTDTPTLTKIPYPEVSSNNDSLVQPVFSGPEILPMTETKKHENESVYDLGSNQLPNSKNLNNVNVLETAENLLSESSDNDAAQNVSSSTKAEEDEKQKYNDQKTVTTIVAGIIGERMQHFKTNQIQILSMDNGTKNTVDQNKQTYEIKNQTTPIENKFGRADQQVTWPSIVTPMKNASEVQPSSESPVNYPMNVSQNATNEVIEPITYSITYPRVSGNENKSINYSTNQENVLPINTGAPESKVPQDSIFKSMNNTATAIAPWPLATPSTTEQKKQEYVQEGFSSATQPFNGQQIQNNTGHSGEASQTSPIVAPAKTAEERPAFEFHQKPQIYTPSVEIYQWPPVVVPAAKTNPPETTSPSSQQMTPDLYHKNAASAIFTEHIIHGKIILQQSWHSLLENPDSVPYRVLTQIVSHSIEQSYSLHHMKVSCEVIGLSKANQNVSESKTMEKVSVKFNMKYYGSEASIVTMMKDEVVDGDIAGLLVYPDSFSVEDETSPTTSPDKQLPEQTSSISPAHQVVATSPIPVENTVEFKPENDSQSSNAIGNINSTTAPITPISKEPDFEFVTAPKDLPKSCEEIRDFGIGTTDGQYVLEARPGCHLSVVCQNMEDKHPKEFLGGPKKSQWEMYPYAVLIKISSHDKESVPDNACLEHSDEGKQLLQQIYTAKGKQPTPSTPWKTNVKRLLDGRRKRALNVRPAIIVMEKNEDLKQEERHPRALKNHEADWGVL